MWSLKSGGLSIEGSLKRGTTVVVKFLSVHTSTDVGGFFLNRRNGFDSMIISCRSYLLI